MRVRENDLGATRVVADEALQRALSVVTGGIAPPLPVATQIVYVNKGGNDVSGTGSILQPFLTIQRAMTSITDSSMNKRYEISLGPGEYSDPFRFKPWTGIVAPNGGENGSTPNGSCIAEITAPMGSVVFDPSWGTSGLAIAWFSGLGWQNAQTFDETTVPGIFPQLTFKACAFIGLMTFIGTASTGIDNVLMQDCLFYGGITIRGWQFLWLRHTETLGGTITVETILGALSSTTLLAQDSAIGAALSPTNVAVNAPIGSPQLARADLSNTSIIGGVTITNPQTSYSSTVEGIGTSVSLVGGAPVPVIKGSGSATLGQTYLADGAGNWTINNVAHGAYAPSVPGNWAGIPPTTVQQALDRIAANTTNTHPIP
jgi:hypothetical protein